MTVSPTAVMSGPHAVERDGAAAAARDRETEFAGQINSLTLDEFLVLPRPRESGQHLARELARAPAAVIQLTHARDSALERDDRAASEVETRPRPR